MFIGAATFVVGTEALLGKGASVIWSTVVGIALMSAGLLIVMLAKVRPWARVGGQAPSASLVLCTHCHEDVPPWFVEHVNEETLCGHCTEAKAYPLAGESKSAFDERWARDKPRP